MYNTILAVLLILAGVLVYIRGSVYVPRTNLDTARLDDLIRFVATHYQFGEADERLTVDEWTSKASRGERVTLTCGYVAEWARVLLTNAGYRVRTVDWYTLHAAVYEGSDIGHTNLEVWHPRYGQWVVVDFSLQRLYPQTALSWQHGRVAYVSLDDTGAVKHDGYEDEDDWITYITGVLIIHDEDDNRWYFESRRTEALVAWDARVQYIDKDSFIRKFYQE